jgi:DNA-dependent RNA polymerase
VDRLEEAARRRNLDRSVRDSRRLVRDFGLAAGHEGHALIQRNIDRLTAFIREKRASGQPTRQTYAMHSLTPEVFARIRGVDDRAIALAAIVGTINATTRPRKGKEKGPARAAKENIGAEIERAARRHYLETRYPTLLAKIERATSHKRKLAARSELEAKLLEQRRVKFAWTKTERTYVGNWALDCCLQALPDIFTTREEDGDTVPTIVEAGWHAAVLMATQAMLRRHPGIPSLEPPEPWIWFTNESGHPFLRNCRDITAAKAAILDRTMRRHMDAINYLQSIPFTIDGAVLEFVRGLTEWNTIPLMKISHGKRHRGLLEVLRWDLEQAHHLREKNFYVALSCEWRGRVQPLPSFSYIRGDHIRALFRFAQGAPINERGIFWLKVSTANCFGGDIARRSFEERAAWCDEHMPMLRAFVDDPVSGIRFQSTGQWGWLHEASDPFQLLSHARELVACGGDPQFITTLPLPLDASNSGAQHYSFLARDPSGARLTNLIDTGKPVDLYQTIADAVRKRLNKIVVAADEAERRRAMWWATRDINRKFIKPRVITFLYGSGSPGQQNTLFDTLSEDEHERIFDRLTSDGTDTEVEWRRPRREDYPPGHLKWFTELVREEIEKVVPGAVEVMDIVRDLASAMSARKARSPHARVLAWTSPSGVPVQNEYLRPNVHERRTYLGARLHRHEIADGWLPELRENECRLASAPNLIHSLDASHLAFVALACESAGIPLVTVHDCFGVLGCHVDALKEIWIRELRAMYGREDILRGLHDYVRERLGPNAKLPPIPKRRGLDLAEVTGRYALG